MMQLNFLKGFLLETRLSSGDGSEIQSHPLLFKASLGYVTPTKKKKPKVQGIPLTHTLRPTCCSVDLIN